MVIVQSGAIHNSGLLLPIYDRIKSHNKGNSTGECVLDNPGANLKITITLI